MSHTDPVLDANQRHWEKMVQEACGFTRPWLHLDPAVLRRLAHAELDSPPQPLDEMYPASLLAGAEGKDVLCLASGGGQQSAVFSLLGARVTVVDLTEGQLQGDRTAAAHYGYAVTTIQADMRDLHMLGDASFDIVFQAPSISYVPDVRPVYAGVQRVLREGGIYRVEFSNPATQFVDTDDWDGFGYRIRVPYAVRQTHKEGREAADFRHHLKDIFNGLIEAGFSIQSVQEAPAHFKQDPNAQPGSWEHWLSVVHGQFAIVAIRQGRA